MILSSELRLGDDECGINDPLIQSGLVRFTGLHRSPSSPLCVGHLLYSGVATFRSGRKQRIFYNQTINTQETFVHAAIDIALNEVKMTMRWAECGVLRNWLNKHAFRSGRFHHRSALTVEWQPWNSIDAAEDSVNHVCH